jgi:hypothetical protein
VLSTPPAFVLSQDQTRHSGICVQAPRYTCVYPLTCTPSPAVESYRTTQSAPGFCASPFVAPDHTAASPSSQTPRTLCARSHCLRCTASHSSVVNVLRACEASPRIAAPSQRHPLNISHSSERVKGKSARCPCRSRNSWHLTPCSLSQADRTPPQGGMPSVKRLRWGRSRKTVRHGDGWLRRRVPSSRQPY